MSFRGGRVADRKKIKVGENWDVNELNDGPYTFTSLKVEPANLLIEKAFSTHPLIFFSIRLAGWIQKYANVA